MVRTVFTLRHPVPILLATSLLGFALSGVLAEYARLPGICGQLGVAVLALGRTDALVAALVALNSPLRMVGEWMLMLAAMMPLLLIGPIGHVARSSLARRRGRAVSMFVSGYFTVWLAIAPLLIAFGIVLRIAFGPGAASAAAIALSLIWSASPMHRRALNAGHRAGRIGLFGAAADRDCLRCASGFGTEASVLSCARRG